MDALQGYAPTWRVSEQRPAPAEHNGHHLHDDLVQAAKSEHLPRHVASENAHVAACSELLRARKPGFDVGRNFYCGVRRKLLWVMHENDDRPRPRAAVDPGDGASPIAAGYLVPAAPCQDRAGRLRDLVGERARCVVFGPLRPGHVVRGTGDEAVHRHRDVQEDHVATERSRASSVRTAMRYAVRKTCCRCAPQNPANWVCCPSTKERSLMVSPSIQRLKDVGA